MSDAEAPRSAPPQNLDEAGSVVRGAEPAPATTVLRHMVYGSGLTHPLDYLVLLHALFRLETSEPFTPRDIWRDLQAEGIRSAKNSSELVGRDAVYAAFKRIIDARFIRRTSEGGGPGRFGRTRYELYRQPAYNPEYAPPSEPWDPTEDPAFPHVGAPRPGTPEAEKADTKTAGGAASRNAGRGVTGSGVPGRGRPPIPPGRAASGVPGSGGALPPHPPGGGGGSPSSPKAPAAPGGQEPGAPGVGSVQVQAAAEWLMDLKRPWAVGRKQARELGAELAEAVAETGWDLDASLALWLCRTEEGKKAPDNHRAVLRHRIEQLERRTSVFPTTRDDAAVASSASGTPAWCGICNRGERPLTLMERLLDVGEDEQVRCPRCHPAALRTTPPAKEK
ncbi:hypothetical protein ABZ203_23350 [Streptomyces albidoflavus]|uniref:hypothetical protein n=1 Tax=Streptomyces albidoflavus TaxID=1886 RepID=UPI0033A79BB9